MLTVAKKFQILDPDYSPDEDTTNFVKEFYSRLINGNHVPEIVDIESYIDTVKNCKKTLVDQNKLLGQMFTLLDNRTGIWIADFDSEQSYNEYKDILKTTFGSDFDFPLDTPFIKMSTTIE